MSERVLQIVGGWKKITDTYMRTLGYEDAEKFHRQISPADKLGRGPRYWEETGEVIGGAGENERGTKSPLFMAVNMCYKTGWSPLGVASGALALSQESGLYASSAPVSWGTLLLFSI